ncbi:ribokinase-like isoform X2 [Gordionus sp. m RMFG-2023]
MLGDDEYGKEYLQNLKNLNIITDYVGVAKDTSTGLASITIDKHGQNFIIVIPGANWLMSPQILNRILYQINENGEIVKSKIKCKVLVTQREVPDLVVLESLKWAKGYYGHYEEEISNDNDEKEPRDHFSDTLTIFNPSPIKASERDELFKSGIFDYCDIVCLNEVEIGMLTITDEPYKGNCTLQLSNLDPGFLDHCKSALSTLMDRLPRVKAIVLTLGQLGVLLCQRNSNHSDNASDKNGNYSCSEHLKNGKWDIRHVVAPKVDAIDTSGAGDSFLGSLAFYCAMYPSLDLHQMINRACFISSQTVKHRGTQSSYLTKNELPQFLF